MEGNGTGSINPGDVATLALLGRGGYGGYGYGRGSYVGPGAEAVRLDRNLQATEDQADCTRTLFGQAFNSIQGAFENATRSGEFNRVCDRLSNIDTRNTDNQFRSELRTNDRLLALQAEMNFNAREAAKCCCEAKLLAVENEAKLMAEIKASEARGIQRDLDRAERQLQTQTILSTCGCGCGGGVRPCPPHPHP